MNPLCCPKCRTPFLETPDAPLLAVKCGKCRSHLEAWIYPAIVRNRSTTSRAEAALDAEATCFFHEGAKVAAACDHCGRFICSLCDIELRGQHYCPDCVERDRQNASDKNLERSRFLWGRSALTLAIVPLIFSAAGAWIFAPVTAPTSLFLAIFGWRKPGSIVSNSHVPHVIAIILSLGQIAGMVFGAAYFIHQLTGK